MGRRGCQESPTCDDLGLSKDNLLCDAALPLVQLLANTGDDAETVLQSVGCLLANELKRYRKTSNHNADNRNYVHYYYFSLLALKSYCNQYWNT